MLNLSDKELDRLSQEAAQQHEPGDIVGPKFWDKLEARLDRDLGKVNPNPARGIRRLPYYYAPVLLVLLGVTWYLVRLNARSHKGTTSGSPPLTLIKPNPAGPLKSASSSNPVISDKSNSTPVAKSTTVPYPAGGAGSPANTPGAPGATASTSGAPGAPTATSTPGSPNSPAPAAASASLPRTSASNNVAHPGTSDNSINPSFTSNNSRTSPVHHRRRNPNTANHIRSTSPGTTADANPTGSNPAAADAIANTQSGGLTTIDPANSAAVEGTAADPTTTRSPREITFSAVRGPVRLNRRPSIDDSALRSVTQASIRPPITRKYLHINRSLTFGILGGPDFASVSSVAGDRSGSIIGITADYQFANHWYIGSGLLLSKKVFGAAPQDYHVPDGYYSRTFGNGSHVEYIKGTFNMLEIPINLRYDFSTTGNTLFFASVGTSSYFFTSENCGYYYNLYTQQTTEKNIIYTAKPDLFTSVNLSMGFETGLSNSLSILIAPYLKMPVRNLGFGQVQLSSFGIDFALRFTPVLSRSRR